MDFDVFGPPDNKVVILGEDNVVIVKDKEAERASNEEIPQAIAELKLEPSDSNIGSDNAEHAIKLEPTANASAEPDVLVTPTKKVSSFHQKILLIHK
jgi:hypothetical protein